MGTDRFVHAGMRGLMLAGLCLAMLMLAGCDGGKVESAADGDLTVTLTADRTSGLAPLLVQFTAAQTGGQTPFTVMWNFQDGDNQQAGLTASHVFDHDGEFDVTVTVTDADGEVASAQLTVLVATNALPRVKISASRTLGVAPVSIDFTADAVGGDPELTYEWTFCDGETANTKAVTHEFTTAGECAVLVRVTDANGDVATDAITVHLATEDLPAVEVTADRYHGIAPMTVNLLAAVAGGNAPVSYQWYLDGTAIDGAAAPALRQELAAGTHVFKCEVTDEDGDKASSEATIEVEEDTTAEVVLTVEGIDEAGLCAGITPLMVHFRCASTMGNPPYTYVIHFGTGDNVAHFDAYYQYVTAGEYTARCEVTDANGNIGVATKSIVVAQGGMVPADLVGRVTNILVNMGQKGLTAGWTFLVNQMRDNWEKLARQSDTLSFMRSFVDSMYRCVNGSSAVVAPFDQRDKISPYSMLVMATPNVFAEWVQMLLKPVFAGNLFDQGKDEAIYRVGLASDAEICEVICGSRDLMNMLTNQDDNDKQELEERRPEGCVADCQFGEQYFEVREMLKRFNRLADVVGVWVTLRTNCDDGITMILGVGPDRVPLVTMDLFPDRIHGVVKVSDLAIVLDHVTSLADVMGSILRWVDQISLMLMFRVIETPAGQWSFDLVVDPVTGLHSLKVAVDEAIDLSLASSEVAAMVGWQPWNLSLTAPVGTLLDASLDSNANALTGTYDIKASLEATTGAIANFVYLGLYGMYRLGWVTQYFPPLRTFWERAINIGMRLLNQMMMSLPYNAIVNIDVAGIAGSFKLDGDGMITNTAMGPVGVENTMTITAKDKDGNVVTEKIAGLAVTNPAEAGVNPDASFKLDEDWWFASVVFAKGMGLAAFENACALYDTFGSRQSYARVFCNQLYTINAVPEEGKDNVEFRPAYRCVQQVQQEGGGDVIDERGPTGTPRYGIEVVSGTLTIDTDLADYERQIVVPTTVDEVVQRCLLVKPICPTDPASWLDVLTVGECPHNVITAHEDPIDEDESLGTVTPDKQLANCHDVRYVTLTPAAGNMVETIETAYDGNTDYSRIEESAIAKLPMCGGDADWGVLSGRYPFIEGCRGATSDVCQVITLRILVDGDIDVRVRFVPLPTLTTSVGLMPIVVRADPVLGAVIPAGETTPECGVETITFSPLAPVAAGDPTNALQAIEFNGERVDLTQSRSIPLLGMNGIDLTYDCNTVSLTLPWRWMFYVPKRAEDVETRNFTFEGLFATAEELAVLGTNQACACRTAEHPAFTFPGEAYPSRTGIPDLALCGGTFVAEDMDDACAYGWHVCLADEYLAVHGEFSIVPNQHTSWGFYQPDRGNYGLWVPRAPTTYAASTYDEFQTATMDVWDERTPVSLVYGAMGKVVRGIEDVPDSDATEEIVLWGDGDTRYQDKSFTDEVEFTAGDPRAVYCCRNVPEE